MEIKNFYRIPFSYLVLFLLLLNLFLISLPLTNSLGFEFSFINRIVLFLIGGFKSSKRNNGLISLLKSNSFENAIIIFIPFLIGFIASIASSRCPIKDGLGFYCIITIPSYVYGMIAGKISSQISNQFPRLFFSIFSLLLIGFVFLEFYLNPQVYFYNPIFGFFPGTIYDEDVAVSLKLVLSQSYNLVFFFLLYYSIAAVKKKVKMPFIPYITFVSGFALFFFIKPIFGFSTPTWGMKRELNNAIETEHFIIYTNKKLSQADFKFVALVHEYYYEQVCNKLNEKLDRKITSFIFNDKEKKRELFGSGNANVAKPWSYQIYLNYDSYLASVKHEIAHIVAAKFGYSIFKVADGFNAAMIEGLAMFAENDFDNYPVHYAAKLAFNTNHKVNLAKLFTGLNFFTSYSSISYIYAGAFFEFLANEYGIEKVKSIYKETSWEKYLGENLERLIARFENKLNDKFSHFNTEQAQLYFGGQTIFKKFCPRMASNDLKVANNYFNEKKYDEAAKSYKDIYNYSGAYSALIGEVVSQTKRKNYSFAKEVLKTEIKKFEKSQSYYNLLVEKADICVMMNDTTNANKNYDSLLSKSPHLSYSNFVKIRKRILASMSKDSLLIYLDGKELNRLLLLMNLNRKEIMYFSIPAIVKLASALSYNLDPWFAANQPKIVVKDNESSNAAVFISQYYLAKANYNLAKDYAVLALKYEDTNEEKFSKIENLRMVNWFQSFADETRKKMKIR